MVYFNYFIKCIIRKISNKLCKPKVFLTVLLSILILFVLHSKGYCAWSDGEVEACLDGLSTITNNQGVIISQLSSMGVDVRDVVNNLNNIKSIINNIKVDTNLTVEKLNSLLNKVDSLNNTLTQMAEQHNIYYQNVTNELNDIKKILTGSNEESTDISFEQDNSFWLSPNPLGSSMSSTVYNSNPGDGRFFEACHFRFGTTDTDYQFEKGYTYTISIEQILTANNGYGRFYYTYDNLVTGNEIYCYYLGNFSQNNFSFTFTPTKDGVITFFTENFSPFWFGMVRYNINKVPNGSLSSIGDNLNNVNNSISQGNQLQQEQNDFLKNDNVSVDSSSLPSDSSQDITEDGFNSIFQQIYNTFTGGAAQDVVITIPFTNKSFTINANTVYSGANLGFVKTLIEAFWYFLISYFIVQDIGKKINKIKSGDIEHVQEDNIKEDLL